MERNQKMNQKRKKRRKRVRNQKRKKEGEESESEEEPVEEDNSVKKIMIDGAFKEINSSLSVKKLQTLCKENNLSYSGNKSQLIKRLTSIQ